jgi:hypothetical protein
LFSEIGVRRAIDGAVAAVTGSLLHLAPAIAVAQTAPSVPPVDPRSTFAAEPLRDLPSSGTLGGFLETTVPAVISDRIEGGGLGVGTAARVGAAASPWSQTAFSLNQINVTEAGAAGRSLLFLDPLLLEFVDVSTTLMPVEQPAPGLAIHVRPARPTSDWQGRFEASIAAPSRAAPAERPPPIAALRTWQRLGGLVTGPAWHDRLRIAAGAVVNDASQFARGDPTVLASAARSALLNTSFTASPATDISAIIVGRVAQVPITHGPLPDQPGQPAARDRLSDLIIQSSVVHRLPSIEWTAAVGYARTAVRSGIPSTPTLVMDSVRDGPVMAALETPGVHRQWSAVLRANGAASNANRWLQGAGAGLEIEASRATASPIPASLIAEAVEGVPARVWRLTPSPSDAQRDATTVIGYVAERVTLAPRLRLVAGVRWEAIDASAIGGGGFSWRDWFPRALMQWTIIRRGQLSVFAGVARYGYSPTLESLAAGDPAAPGADVLRWDDRNGDGRPDPSELGPLVARAGGAPATSAIDPGLRRPSLDEFVAGLELRPSLPWTLRLSGATRAERRLIALVDTGAPAAAYTVRGVPDVGADLLDPADDQVLPLYSRRPEAFGADRYALTNPAGFSTSAASLELTVQHTGERLWLLAGATATRSSGPALARGFLASENDRGIPGDLYIDPNAMTFARGRYFADRAYTIKTSGIYRWAHDVRLGIAARYEDGQPFSRLVLAPDLAQGAEVVRAYHNGRTRFAYTLTVDTRLQKGFSVARARGRVVLVADVFNLLNLANEVEEVVLTGPQFRKTTAVQPPRAVHVGLQYHF